MTNTMEKMKNEKNLRRNRRYKERPHEILELKNALTGKKFIGLAQWQIGNDRE